MIEIKNLKKTYGERCVLDIEDLSLEQGESLVVAGANGSGKTTLMRILARMIQPTSGTFRCPSDVLYLPQKAYAFNGTVKDNVLIGVKKQTEKAEELLERFCLAELKNKKAAALSGGELQRLSLCRLMMRPCSLLLLDEPTSACDTQSTELCRTQIKRYCAENGCTLIVNTHSPVFAADLGEKLLILDNGRPAAFGSPEALISSPPSEAVKNFMNRWRF